MNIAVDYLSGRYPVYAMLTIIMFCISSISEICYMPSDPGPCQEYSSRYYFNTNTGVCEEFMYGGCEGNGNNFATLDECSRLCNPNGMESLVSHAQ